jgi:serine/threonine protein phosphatase PrpC
MGQNHFRMTPATPLLDLKLATWFMRRVPPTGVRRVASLSAAIASDVGTVREENQDRVAIARGTDRYGCTYVALALADGIGGMKEGGRCAAMALGGFFASLDDDARAGRDQKTWLSRGAARANANVHGQFGGSGGSTLVAALVTGPKRVQWLSVGDSRVHIARAATLKQLSIDDTIAGQLGKMPQGGINSSNLLQFIGIGPQLEAHVADLEEPLDGSIMLTSDGVHFVDSAWLGQIVGHAQDAGVCVRRLVELSKWCGGPDNASVVMIAVDADIERPKSADLSGLEVWDPYGELQLLSFDLARSEPPPSKTVTPVLNQSPRVGETTTPVARPGKGKRKRGSAKSPAKEGRTVGTEGADPANEPPQLVIEFPRKAS